MSDHELRAVFERTGDGVRVRLENGASRGKARPFGFALSDGEHEDLRWYLESYMDLPDAGSRVRAASVEGRITAWGRALYGALFDHEEGGRLVGKLKRAPGPRLLTIATDLGEVLRLPWEIIADERGPLVRQQVTVRRDLELAEEVPAFAPARPLRIVVIVSRPDDTGFIDTRLTTRSMFEALAPLGDDVEVDLCEPPTLARLEELLTAGRDAGRPYHIVHFDGHGTFLAQLGLGALCFEQADDGAAKIATDLVRADQLGALLAGYDVPLAILEACRSSTLDEAAIFRSVAPRLVKAGVGSVLAMSHAVHVEAARLLLARFYRRLVAGGTIGQALEDGRAALLAQRQRWVEPGPQGRKIALDDWFVPTLYQRGEDLRLVSPRPSRPAAAADGAIDHDLFLSHQHADKARIERLATTLRDRHGLRVWFDAWAMQPGPLRPQCAAGIERSRFVVLACSRAALESDWVQFEHDVARVRDLRGERILPLLLEDVALPAELQALFWLDLRDPAGDDAQAAEIKRLIGAAAPAPAAAGSTATAPAAKREPGGFPPPPAHRFHGRARELHQLERAFRRHRAVLLHAMGGMGKTSLAREAAFWWTRTGRFADGACFVSFERGGGADVVVRALGTYLDGASFEALPVEQQYARAKELFRTRRVLLVWDNFESVLPAFQEPGGAALYGDDERARIRALYLDLTGDDAGEGRLLVTCRPEETGLPAARRVELHGLARPDSLWLLARVLDTTGVSLDDERLGREALDELLDELADHPLSIELVGPHLKTMRPQEIVADFRALLGRFKGDAEVERNRSLLASLDFSTRRLSEPARAMLPWLGLFRGGVFEEILLDVSQVAAEAWESIRGELEATALLRVEREFLLAERPYLRFHPTLPYAPGDTSPLGDEEATGRFVAVYFGVMRSVDGALNGSNPRGGMEVMEREEANFRAAVRVALESGFYDEAANLGDTVRSYLQRAGRMRERDRWSAWLAGEVGKGGFTAAAAAAQREAAMALAAAGKPREAVARLGALIERLAVTSEFDAGFELAALESAMGRVLLALGQSPAAITLFESSVGRWESLIERKKQDQGDPASARGNLSGALSNLANALMSAGQLDRAMAVAKRGVQIDRELRLERNLAAGLGQVAEILMLQGRHAEADARYDEAITAARRAGDKELEGTGLQHQGGLARRMGLYPRATDLYRRALRLFQEMGDEEGVMQTCNLLGVVERKQGRLPEARSWYQRSREIATQRGATDDIGVAAHNLGVICQLEGEAALERGDRDAATGHLADAERWLVESLRIKVDVGNKPGEANAWSQLARLYLLRGQLDEAEQHAHHAREIRESLGLKDAAGDYNTLAEIARARGDEAAAAEWQRKFDDLVAELERRAGGSGLPPQLVEALQAVAAACAQACVDGTPLAADIDDALAQIAELPPPLTALAAFLRALAAGTLAAIPPDFPPPLPDFFARLLAAVREARP